MENYHMTMQSMILLPYSHSHIFKQENINRSYILNKCCIHKRIKEDAAKDTGSASTSKVCVVTIFVSLKIRVLKTYLGKQYHDFPSDFVEN